MVQRRVWVPGHHKIVRGRRVYVRGHYKTINITPPGYKYYRSAFDRAFGQTRRRKRRSNKR